VTQMTQIPLLFLLLLKERKIERGLAGKCVLVSRASRIGTALVCILRALSLSRPRIIDTAYITEPGVGLQLARSQTRSDVRTRPRWPQSACRPICARAQVADRVTARRLRSGRAARIHATGDPCNRWSQLSKVPISSVRWGRIYSSNIAMPPWVTLQLSGSQAGEG
jgi:hypothetical protein